MKIQSMKIVVKLAGIYNASAVVAFLTPGMLPMLGVTLPSSPFWVWLPALVGLFAGIVLLISSSDLSKYAVFPYWNGIIRLVFVVASFVLDFGATAGMFVTLLAIGDLPLGLLCVFGIPKATHKTHRDLLLNR